jgi:type II secretory ATPase GspE/PulE/Tfp pilus assembly ATPase PilB-like protein
MKQKKQRPAAGKPAGKSEKPPRSAGKSRKPVPPASAEHWVNQLIIRATRDRASDIHIEQTRKGLTVRFRTGGVLHSVNAPQKDLESAIVSRIKTMSRMNPVEFDLDGVRQSQVDPRAGYTYPLGLAKVLRQDPDVIGLGGLRDAEIAEAAIGAALTGRRVFSTMHADDASETVTRLVEMGVEPFLVAKGLKGVIAQRLVRLNCPACKTSYPADAKASRMLGNLGVYLKPGHKLFKGRGCAKCNNTGYQGQIGIFEVLPITNEIRDLVATRPPWSAVNKLAREAGVERLLDDGIEKVRSGVTTVEEVIRATRKS